MLDVENDRADGVQPHAAAVAAGNVARGAIDRAQQFIPRVGRLRVALEITNRGRQAEVIKLRVERGEVAAECRAP